MVKRGLHNGIMALLTERFSLRARGYKHFAPPEQGSLLDLA